MSTGPGGGPGYHGNGGPGHHKPGHHGPGHHGDGGPGYYGNGYPAPAAPIGTAGTVPLGSGSVVIYPTGAYSWTNETANHTAPVVPTRTKTEVVIPTDSEPSMTYIVTEVGQPSSQPTPTSTAAPAGNAGSRAKIPSGLQFWCTMLLMMSTFLQGALASPNSGSAIKRQDDPVDVPDNIDSDDNNIVTASGSESEDDSQDDGTRDLKAQVLSVQDTFTDFYASAVPDSDLGVTLVQAAAEAVCNASRQAIQEHPDDWTHREDVVMSLIGECSDSINSFSYNGADEFDTKPQGRLLLRLGSSWVCSQFISLVLEEEEDAVDAICDNVQKPCSEDLLNDDDNCGRCGNQVCLFSPSHSSLTSFLLSLERNANVIPNSVLQVPPALTVAAPLPPAKRPPARPSRLAPQANPASASPRPKTTLTTATATTAAPCALASVTATPAAIVRAEKYARSIRAVEEMSVCL